MKTRFIRSDFDRVRGFVVPCLVVGGAILSACGASSGTLEVVQPDGGGARDGAPAGLEGGPVELSHCPAGKPGPALARVRWSDGIAFCIDATEVTNADYALFLAAGVGADTQAPRCQPWNGSFAPAAPDTRKPNGPPCPPFDPVGRAARPVVCVDWCDADAYCRWAGKRLCGRPGGGPVTQTTDRTGSEWWLACSGDTPRRFPYGDDPIQARCVDRRYPQTAPDVRPVEEASTCEGGVAGAFDMSGNAWEWLDDCEESHVAGATLGGDDACTPRGGSYASDVTASSCVDSAPFHRGDVAGDTGFRCCADADFF